MSEEYKSPWQIEHEKMLVAKESEKRAQAQEERREFLRRLRLTRKSDKTLHSLIQSSNSVQKNKLEEKKEQKNTLKLSMKNDASKTSSKYSSKKDSSKAFKNEGTKSGFSHEGFSFDLELDWLIPLLKKALPLLMIFFIAFVISIYSLSPLNKIGAFRVTGNSMVTSAEVASASKLNMRSSIYNIMTHKATIEAKIVNSSARVESANIKLSFPNTITVQVKEFGTIGYVEQKGKAYNILANGTKVDESVITPDKENLNSLVLKDFTDNQVKEFVLEYETLAGSLKTLIRTVTLTPSQTTSDFITLQMSDGNQVKVPLSQMEQKLPYYPSVAKSIVAPQTVDMEVGIFSKDTPSYNTEFADDNPAGLSKSLSASRAASTISSGSSSSGSSSSNTTNVSSN